MKHLKTTQVISLCLFSLFIIISTESTSVLKGLDTINILTDSDLLDFEEIVRVQFEYEGVSVSVELSQTRDLLAEGYREYYLVDGEYVHRGEGLNCHYVGEGDNGASGFVVSTCRGVLSGRFYFNGESTVIKPVDGGDGRYFIYKDTDFPLEAILKDPIRPDIEETSYEKRGIQENYDGTLYMELVVYNSRTAYNTNGANTTTFSTESLHQANFFYQKAFFDGVFSKNIKIVVVAQVTVTTSDPWGTPTSASSTEINTNNLLDIFNTYIYSLTNRIYGDAYLLLDGRDFDGSTIGLAHLGVICGTSYSTGTVSILDADTTDTGLVSAHELGHILGMEHDGDKNSCTSSGFIMAAYKGTGVTSFSSCSSEYLDSTLKTQGGCLVNIPKKTYSSFCGDGLVEGEEECDCGTSEICKDACCDANTCKLVGDAECAGDICCNNCKLADSSTICYDKAGQCDNNVYCTGKDTTCDLSTIYKSVGSSCSTGNCDGEGECISFQLQCQGLNDAYSGNFMECSLQSYYADRYGKDICATLYCGVNGDSKSCTTFTVSPSGSLSVQNGVSCGTDKFCYNNVCTSSSEIPQVKTIVTSSTSNDGTNEGTNDGTNDGTSLCVFLVSLAILLAMN